MAKTTTLKVTTPFGTFTRQTARTYTHFVVVCGFKAEALEAIRLAEIQMERTNAAKYRRILADGCDVRERSEWHRQNTLKNIADGSLAKWADQAEARAARLEAKGPITQDRDSWGLTDANLASTPTFGVAGWCGRLDLARKLAEKQGSYRTVAIIEVATGQVVR